MNYLIITGPSGAGKSTIIDYIIKNDELFKLNVSYTSRLPRTNEINGIHYHFITHENFLNQIKNDFFLEHTNFSGNYYGTAKDDNDVNSIVILDLDARGAEFFKSRMPDAFFCLVTADSEVIRDRLEKRIKTSETGINNKYEMESMVSQRLLSVSDFSALSGIEFNEVIATDKMNEKMMFDKSMKLIEKVKNYYKI